MPASSPDGSRRARLLALAVALPVAELLVVWALVPGNRALAPQVTAPEPFGAFHDLRWLLVYHPNWAAFVLEAAAFVAFRAAVTAAFVRLAWPVEAGPPPGWRAALAFTLVTTVLLAPWAALLFGMAVISLSWLFYVAVPCTLVVAVLAHAGVADREWWRRRPPLRTVGWVLVTFATLSVTGALLTEAPALLWVPVTAAAGLVNGRAWERIVHTAALRPLPHRGRVPAAPAAVGGLLVVASVGTVLGFHFGAPQIGALKPAPARGRPVLVVTGFGGTYDGLWPQHVPGDFHEQRFSYRGVDGDGTPLPFEGGDTLQSLDHLVALLDRQVRAFHRATGRPVAVVAESEGALVAKAYLAAHPEAPVDHLVMLSPLSRLSRAYYPPSGDDGWGVGGAAPLRVLTGAIRGLTPLSVSTETALFRSMADGGARLRELVGCDLPGVEELIVMPVGDAMVAPDGAAVPVVDVPAFHGGMLDNAAVREVVADALNGQPRPRRSAWTAGAKVVGALSAAWHAPELPLSLNPAWAGGTGCRR